MNEKLTFKDSQKVKKDVDASHVDKVLKRLSFISLVLVMFFLVVCMRLTEVSLKGGLYGIQKSQNEPTENKKRGSIVDRNGKSIMGISQSLKININNFGFHLTWTGSTWRVH